MNKLYNKPITLELVEKVFEKSKEDRKWVFYTSELGKIEFECVFWLKLNDKIKQANYILNLFNKLKYIRKVIKFIKVKKHHIEIGYSSMDKKEYENRINKWVDLEDYYITKIKKEYYK